MFSVSVYISTYKLKTSIPLVIADIYDKCAYQKHCLCLQCMSCLPYQPIALTSSLIEQNIFTPLDHY